MRFKENDGRLNIEDKEIDEVRSIVLEPRIREVEPFAKVTLDGVVWDSKVEKRFELPVIWYVALESTTHFEEGTRYVLHLPD